MEVAMSSTSLAHTYGNVTCFMTEYIKSLFPNYFKSVHISSSLAYGEFKKLQNNNTKLIKKSKPTLIIRPRVEIDDNDTFLYGTYLTMNMTNQYMQEGYSNLQPFIHDQRNKIYIKWLLNRLKIVFDVSILVETQMEQINMSHYLKNRMPINRPFILETCLESHLPRHILDVYSQETGMPIYDNNGSVKYFLDRLNKISHYPVTYKMKTSSGNDEFFRYYPVKLDTMIQNLSIDDGNKKGMTFDYFTINFTMPVEFNAAGLYYYFTNNINSINKLNGLTDEANGKYSKESELFPLFTLSNLFDIKVPPGWNLYATSCFKVDLDDTYKEDIINLRPLVAENMLEFIKHHEDNGMEVDPFIQVHLLRDNRPLVYGEHYTFDFNSMDLVIKTLNPISTYRVVIYINSLYINELMMDLHNMHED